MIHRRELLIGSAIALLGAGRLARAGSAADKSFLPQGLPDGVYDTAALEALPGKKPLIKLSYRPRRTMKLRCPISRRNLPRTIPSSCAITSPASRTRSIPRSGG